MVGFWLSMIVLYILMKGIFRRLLMVFFFWEIWLINKIFILVLVMILGVFLKKVVVFWVILVIVYCKVLMLLSLFNLVINFVWVFKGNFVVAIVWKFKLAVRVLVWVFSILNMVIVWFCCCSFLFKGNMVLRWFVVVG